MHELFTQVHALLTQHRGARRDRWASSRRLSGVREFPARVKCASLCWHTLNAALEQGGTISTEAGNESSSEVCA